MAKKIEITEDECVNCANLQREIDKLKTLARLVTVNQVFAAGNDAINASGLNPWCINEGRATGEETLHWLD
jgi:hypothetical protein